jgi:hypothetical protein
MALRWLVVVGVLLLVVGRARMAFAIKPGATISTDPRMVYARDVCAGLFESLAGVTLTVTSGTDSVDVHRAGSLHGQGLAEDYRTRDMPLITQQVVSGAVAVALGADYDVVLEADHLHVEYDPA